MGLRLVRPQLLEDGAPIETISEIALLTCLFCLGLRLKLPIDWGTWRIPLRLSTLTTLATVGLAAAAAHLMFDMSLAESLLLGAIIAPTDSVIAADVGSLPETEQDSPAFILSAESGINNGLASALVMWVLAWMGLGDSESGALGTSALLGLWSIAGGIVAGGLIGAGMARWIRLLD